MSALLLRLAAPLQSWGDSAKFEKRRETQRMPTKSGVVGLLAAALGRKRTDSLDDLNALIMCVRADQEGVAQGLSYRAAEKNTYVTNRFYLADAVFTVALEGEEELLENLRDALHTPVYPLFLGRRSCPPQGQLVLGIREGLTARQALEHEPWQASAWYRRQKKNLQRLEVLMEAAPGSPGAFFQRDLPLSFSQAYRQHGFRSVVSGTVALRRVDPGRTNLELDATYHDAFADWGE